MRRYRTPGTSTSGPPRGFADPRPCSAEPPPPAGPSPCSGTTTASPAPTDAAGTARTSGCSPGFERTEASRLHARTSSRSASARPLRGPAEANHALVASADDTLESIDRGRHELRARAAPQLGDGALDRHRLSVHTVLDHGVERVADGDHVGTTGDVGTRQAVGIAAPVPALVRRADERHDVLHARDAGDDVRADHGVLLHHGELVVGQWAG